MGPRSAVPAGSPARPGARAVVAAIAEGFVELDAELTSWDPLGWPGYSEQRERAHGRSGEVESVVCGRGLIGGTDAYVVAFDFRFIGGSMGAATGEKIVRAFAQARDARRPIVSLIASGGSRMQEGMRSLVQLQRIAAACEQTRAAGLLHLAVLRHPTTGGMWAALGGGADVILAVRDATVAFAGHRVRSPSPADADAYTGTGKAAHGQADGVVEEDALPAALAGFLALLGDAPAQPPEPAEAPAALGRTDLPDDGWSAVRRARDPGRPRAGAYLDAYFESRVAIAGDRAGGRDPGMLCGFGRRGGRTIAYAAQAGTATTPAGYRTAARLVRLADRLGFPVLTLVDTPGAANDADAERAAIGPAIAEAFGAVAAARVPVTTLVIGEGGSGGALALASAADLWIAPDAYFSVIAPEAAASILKEPPSAAPAVAGRLRLRPQDLVELGIARGIARPAAGS
jgi:acetyl-CoA carboxylase carboxyl transferase subunit beta